MTAVHNGALDRVHPLDVGELAEIHSVGNANPILKARPDLLPGEEEASLPPLEVQSDPTLVSLKQLLGERLTSGNAAWSGDPIPRMRALQKKLIEHSLTLEQADRMPCMDAIRVVELAVQWRLRWQQMRRSDVEANLEENNPNQAEESFHEEEEAA